MSTLGLDHVGLTVSNLAAARDFFVDCLGWTQFGGNDAYPSAYVTDGTAKLTLRQQRGETALDWPGVVVDFGPEFFGKGPEVHCMQRKPGGTRLELSYDPR